MTFFFSAFQNSFFFSYILDIPSHLFTPVNCTSHRSLFNNVKLASLFPNIFAVSCVFGCTSFICHQLPLQTCLNASTFSNDNVLEDATCTYDHRSFILQTNKNKFVWIFTIVWEFNNLVLRVLGWSVSNTSCLYLLQELSL